MAPDRSRRRGTPRWLWRRLRAAFSAVTAAALMPDHAPGPPRRGQSAPAPRAPRRARWRDPPARRCCAVKDHRGARSWATPGTFAAPSATCPSTLRALASSLTRAPGPGRPLAGRAARRPIPGCERRTWLPPWRAPRAAAASGFAVTYPPTPTSTSRGTPPLDRGAPCAGSRRARRRLRHSGGSRDRRRTSPRRSHRRPARAKRTRSRNSSGFLPVAALRGGPMRHSSKPGGWALAMTGSSSIRATCRSRRAPGP